MTATPAPSSWRVRPARLEDWETIVEFNALLAEESEGKKLDLDRLRPGVQAILSDAHKGRYYVACDGDRIIGQLMHTWEWSDWRNGDIWWLQSVYVHPDLRRRGVFRCLFEHLLHAAETDPGVVGVRLYVENANQVAQETYHQFGLRPGGYHVLERWFLTPRTAIGH